MPKDLFAFAADLHLQPHAWAARPQLAGDAYSSFEQIVTRCLQLGIRTLLLGGDIWDRTRPDPESVSVFIAECARFKAGGGQVFAVQGDHDHHPTSPWFALADAATPLHGRVIEVDGYSVCGLDFTPRDQLQAALQALPPSHFLLSHQSWAELQGIGHTDGEAHWVVSAQELLTGDYHGERLVTVPRSGLPALRVVSPGSTCLQAIDESPDKSFVVCSAEAGVCTYRREPLLTRRKIELTANTPAELASLLTEATMSRILSQSAGLPPQLRRPIVRFRYRDDIPDAAAMIRAWAASHVFLFMAPEVTVEAVAVDMPQAGGFETVLSAVRRMTESDDVYGLAARLLGAADVDGELDAIVAAARSGG